MMGINMNRHYQKNIISSVKKYAFAVRKSTLDWNQVYSWLRKVDLLREACTA